MKRLFLLLCLALGAGATRAHAAPTLVIGYIEYKTRIIGGQTVTSKNLMLAKMDVLGTWVFEDKEGQHGYIFVDAAQEARLKNEDLLVRVGERVFEINRMQRWKTGESALILDDLDAASAAILKQNNFRAPLEEELEVKWQQLEGAKVRLTVTNGGSQTLRLALHNAQYIVKATRGGKPTRASITPDGIDEAPRFETLQPKAVWQRDLILGPDLETSQAGHYKVEVETQFPMRTGGTDKAPAYIVLKFPAQFEFDIAPKP